MSLNNINNFQGLIVLAREVTTLVLQLIAGHKTLTFKPLKGKIYLTTTMTMQEDCTAWNGHGKIILLGLLWHTQPFSMGFRGYLFHEYMDTVS